MGTSVFYGRLSRVRLSLSIGWDAALSRRPSTLPTRAQAGTRRLPSGAVCCAHRPLSGLSLAFAVSRKQFQRQASAGECGVLAALFRMLASSPPLEDASPPLPLAPVLWKDWPRCHLRRGWLKVVRSETVRLTSSTTPVPVTRSTEEVFTRAQRAHWRFSWDQRLARNARPSDAPSLTVTLHGLPPPLSTPSVLLSPRHHISEGHTPPLFPGCSLTRQLLSIDRFQLRKFSSAFCRGKLRQGVSKFRQ